MGNGLLAAGSLLTRFGWYFRPPEFVNPEREDAFRKVMRVFREYFFDLDADIEGYSGDELTEIDRHFAAAHELRRRIVAHVVNGADARGQFKKIASEV